MAKSIRSKSKLAMKRRARERSHYQVSDAARTARLSARLLGKGKGKADGEVKVEDGEDTGEVKDDGDVEVEDDAEMDDVKPKKVTTSGSREPRRETWRISKGMTARPRKHINSKGALQGRRKAGRPKRRR